MQTKQLTALITADRIKLAILALAIVFLAIDVWETKSIGSAGWMLLCITWSWPEPKVKEENK